MMYSRKELIEWASVYASYCASVRANQMMPMKFEDFLEKKEGMENNRYETNIDEVINYLNYHAKLYGKKGFMKKGKKIRSLIRTKLKEGFTLEDFKKVIEIKTAWLNDKSMHKYYRPITLFGGKFEDYLNESSEPIEENNQDEFTEAINRAATDTY